MSKKVVVDEEYLKKKEKLREYARKHPVEFFKWITGFEPRPFQKKFMKTNKRRVIVVTSRQIGKSEVTAVKAIWKAWLFDNQYILILSPTLRQSQELFKKVKRNINNRRVVYEDVIRTTQTEIEFTNGSIIKVIPGTETSVRGFTADMVIIDEAAYVSEEVYGAVEPVVAVKRGQMILISTPGPPRGIFYRIWTEGDPKVWEKIRATFEEANYDPEFVENYRRTHTEVEYKREILGIFADDESETLFTVEMVEGAMDKKLGKRGIMKPEDGFVYYVGVDVARLGGDYTAIAVVGIPVELFEEDVNEDDFYAEVHHIYLRKENISRIIGYLKKEVIPKWNPVRIGIDTIGVGAGVVDILKDELGDDRIVEIKAVGNDRIEMYMLMKRLLEEKRILLPNDPVITEHFSNYEVRYSSTGRVQIKKKSDGHDDIADAITYAVWTAFNDTVHGIVKVDTIEGVDIDKLLMGW